MGDDENANKKRKREQQAAAREAGEVQPELVGGAEVEAEAEAVAMEQDGSESGREDGPSDALRRLLEPFAREQLVEILASAYVSLTRGCGPRGARICGVAGWRC